MEHLSPYSLHHSDWLCACWQVRCSGSPGIWGRRSGRPGAELDQPVPESSSPEKRWEILSQLCPTVPQCLASSLQDPGIQRWPVQTPPAPEHYFSASSNLQPRHFRPLSLARISPIQFHRCDTWSSHSVCSSLLLFPAPKGHSDIQVPHWVQLRHWRNFVAGG